ncbi:TonB family protein [bacterium]|nr:TonB family protein [bacterium]
MKNARAIFLLFTTLILLSPASQAEPESKPEPNSARERETILFLHESKDCCSCSITPDICGGRFYLRSINRSINLAWTPLPKKAFPVKVRLKIARSGKIIESSVPACKDPKAVELIRTTITKADPLHPLPFDARQECPETVEIEVSFKENPKPPQEKHFSDSALARCLHTIQTEAESKFKHPNSKNFPSVAIDFEIDSDGRLENISVKRTSGNQEFDKAMTKVLSEIKQVPVGKGLQKNVEATIVFSGNSARSIYFESVTYQKN